MKFVLIKLLIAVCLISGTLSSLLSANELHNPVEMPLQASAVYTKQLQQMISEQDHAIKIYQEQLKAPNITRSELLALAKQLLTQLQEWIELDLPFLRSERRLRIEGLHRILASSDSDMTEKIRHILEAYRIEAEYGFAFESYREKFNTENMVVDFMHIGRNILIYKSLDGRQVGAWNKYTADWQPLNMRYRNPIKQAFNVARRGMTPEILLLPTQLTQAAAHSNIPHRTTSRTHVNTCTNTTRTDKPKPRSNSPRGIT